MSALHVQKRIAQCRGKPGDGAAEAERVSGAAAEILGLFRRAAHDDRAMPERHREDDEEAAQHSAEPHR